MESVIHAKSSSSIEVFRKLTSRVVAALFLSLALFAVPPKLGGMTGWGMEMAGYLLLIVAALGRVWCALYISGRKDRILCEDGPYSLTRNPLYFFSFLGLVGFAIALGSFALAAAVALVYLGYYRYVIHSEETRLGEIFGGDYVAYLASTPRFFPALRRPSTPASLTVNPRIIERALKEIVWFLFAIVFIEVLEEIHQAGHLVWWQLPW